MGLGVAERVGEWGEWRRAVAARVYPTSQAARDPPTDLSRNRRRGAGAGGLAVRDRPTVAWRPGGDQ